MKHENTRELHRYWEDLRTGRAAPYRSEVDPREIARLLDSTFILERVNPSTTRFRLAGTRLCEAFGMELRGMSALALWNGECRDKVRALLAEVTETPTIGHVACSVETRSGQMMEAEFLYMPLRSDFGEMNRLLGCGYYMRRADDIQPPQAASEEPIRHWVERITTLPIEIETEGDPAPRSEDDRRALKTTIALLEDRLRRDMPAGGAGRSKRPTARSLGLDLKPMPQLRAISGGVRGGLPIGVDRGNLADRPRDHLRIVKPD